jgi:hypothetical protein
VSAPAAGEGQEAAAGIARLEGYLLAQSEASAARTAAEDFTSRLPWLDPEQREEVVRLYTADRMALSRRTLEHIVHRSRELRAEYTDRYQQLRRRLICTTCLALAAASAYGWAVVRLRG